MIGAMGATRAVTATHSRATIFLFGGLEFGPLVRGENGADAEEHAGMRFFELGAGLSGVVDLREDLIGVRLIGGEHGAHLGLLLFEAGAQVHELRAVLLKDVIHALLLVGGKVQLLDQIRIVPPDAGRAEADFTPRAAVRIHAAVSRGAGRRGTAVGLLGDCQGSSECCEQSKRVNGAHD